MIAFHGPIIISRIMEMYVPKIVEIHCPCIVVLYVDIKYNVDISVAAFPISFLSMKSPPLEQRDNIIKSKREAEADPVR